MGLPVLAFQIWAALSSEVVTTHSPLGLNSAHSARSRWRSRSVSGWPVKASQTRSLASSDPVTTRRPSGLKRATLTFALCTNGSASG